MIYDNLKNDYKNFLKNKNTNLKTCVQLVLADIKQYSVDTKKDITDDVCISILNKNIKQIYESKEFAEKEKREELVNEYEARVKYLNTFLPVALSKEDVKKIVYSILSEIRPLNKGIAMKAVMPTLKGKANGKIISEVVENYLSDC
jgi:uncharacterized protein YqeY